MSNIYCCKKHILWPGHVISLVCLCLDSALPWTQYHFWPQLTCYYACCHVRVCVTLLLHSHLPVSSKWIEIQTFSGSINSEIIYYSNERNYKQQKIYIIWNKKVDSRDPCHICRISKYPMRTVCKWTLMKMNSLTLSYVRWGHLQVCTITLNCH